MNLMHVYRMYYPDPPGGIQEVMRQICLSTKPFGVDSRIFTLSKDPNPEILERKEAKVIRGKSYISPASCDIGGLKEIFQFKNQAKAADVLNFHFPWPFADLMHCFSGVDKPSIMTYHSDIVRQKYLGMVYSPLMWKMLERMNFVVATSPNYAATSPVLNDRRVRDKVKVIPLAIDDKSYPVGDDSIFEKNAFSASDPYFLFIGVPRYYKGVHDLVSAARNIDARVVIAGSGGETENLKKQAEELGLKNIVFAGYVSDAEKVALLEHCTALVLPSHLRSEAFGMVLIEAAMYCKPMISCEIGSGTSYANLDGESGIVVEPNKPEQLASAMRTLLSDSSLNRKLGLAARARYEQLFSAEAQGRAYASLYQEAMQ